MKFAVIGLIVTIIYQIYSTHKMVIKLTDEIDNLKNKFDELKQEIKSK